MNSKPSVVPLAPGPRPDHHRLVPGRAEPSAGACFLGLAPLLAAVYAFDPVRWLLYPIEWASGHPGYSMQIGFVGMIIAFTFLMFASKR